MDAWCESSGIERGETITLTQAWELSRRFYGDRLSLGWRRKSAEEYQALFAEVGLSGSFWRLVR